MAENGAAEAATMEDLLEDDDDEEFEVGQGADFVGGASSSEGPSVTSPEHVANERGGDSTECSSSFADSFCETSDEADIGDLEVNSPFSVHADGGQASATSELPRKKKVTADWRNVVRPMLWRCEWLELRMKDLLSQVSKYDSQLALIKQEKELQRAISKTESGKSCRGRENITMERRKRKRNEDTVDTSLYLKKHQILSYFFDKDKQNKGAETGGLLIDDDSHGPVGDDTKRLLDIVGLPASKDYDMVSKQFMIQKILLKIGGLQSRVHRLQERLSKARSKQAKLASFMDQDQVELAEKRQRTQKRAFSPTIDRYAKPQKKKKLNILLEQEDRLAVSVRPTLSEGATDLVKEEPLWISEETAAEKSQAHKKAITADLLLGVESSLPNGHLRDLCRENTDDILIDNRGAEEGYRQPFENAKHPVETPPVPTQTVAKTAPSKAGTSSEPAEAEKIPVPVIKQEQEQIVAKPPALTLVYTGRRWRKQDRPEDAGSAAASKHHSQEASAKQIALTTTPAENENAGSKRQKTMDTRSSSMKLNFVNSCSDAKKLRGMSSSSAAETPKTGNLSSAAKTPNSGNSSSAAKMPITIKISTAGNKRASGNSSSAAKSPKTGNSSSAGNKQAAGNSSAGAKKPIMGNSSSDGKKQAVGNPSAPAARKEMGGNMPATNMRIEKAILVEVNSRRSQRVRKPKVY